MVLVGTEYWGAVEHLMYQRYPEYKSVCCVGGRELPRQNPLAATLVQFRSLHDPYHASIRVLDDAVRMVLRAYSPAKHTSIEDIGQRLMSHGGYVDKWHHAVDRLIPTGLCCCVIDAEFALHLDFRTYLRQLASLKHPRVRFLVVAREDVVRLSMTASYLRSYESDYGLGGENEARLAARYANSDIKNYESLYYDDLQSRE